MEWIAIVVQGSGEAVMSARLLPCPHCQVTLKIATSQGKKAVKCPKCANFIPLETTDPPARTNGSIIVRSEPQHGKRRQGDNSIWAAAIGGGVVVVALIALALGLSAGSGATKIAKGSLAAPALAKSDIAKATPDEPQNAKADPPLLVQLKDEPADLNLQLKQPAVIPVLEQRMPDGEPPWKDERPFLVTDAAGHSAIVRACMFHPDGDHVITVSSDKTVRVWDWKTGETVRVFRLPIGPGPEGHLGAGAVSPDGKWLAVGGTPYGMGRFGVMIYLLSLETGQVEKVLRGHTNQITGLAFAHHGSLLASISHDLTARLYDVASGETVQVFEGHAGAPRSLAFSADDKLLATASQVDGSVRIWSVATGAVTAEIRDFPDTIVSVSWSPVAPILASGCVDGTLQLWTDTGTRLKSYKIREGEPIQPVAMAFTPDGKEILYGGVDSRGKAGIFNLDQGRQRVVFSEHANTVMDARLSNDGRLVISTGGDHHETYIWKASDGSVVQKLVGTGKTVWGVGWRLDSKAIGWGNINWSATKTLTPLTPLEHSFVFEDLDFGPPPTPDFGRIASSVNGYSLKALDFHSIGIFKDGQQIHTFSPSKVERLYSFSTLIGNRAVIGGSDRLYLIDLATGQILRTFTGHSGIIMGVSPAPNGHHFLTGATDQTICLWDPDKNSPLLSFFVAGREWIAWTPEGYYAASPYGERLMGWLINNGPDRLASFHPAARFHDSLYQPEVIKLVFRERSLQKALEIANKQRPEALAEVNVVSVLPPEVTIVSPAAGPAIKAAKIDVKAKAKNSGAYPVTAMRLLVDGRPYQGDRGLRKFAGGKLGEVEAAWKVDLLPGKHQLAVLAESPVSKGLSPVVEITRAGTLSKERPNLYVLAAGISTYPGDMALKFAHADAMAIEKVLKGKTSGLFSKVESRVLTNAKGTRDNILGGLAWLEAVVTSKDVAVVFLSGHGARDPLGQFHFIPVDVDSKNMAASCISGDLLKKRLANIPGRVVAMLDACHSGSATTKKAAADGLVRDLVSEDYGVITMCSSLGKESSLESTGAGHGFFTLSLVEALSGKADFNNDGYIYIHEMDFYALARVRQLSLGQQNPVTGRPANIRSFPLAKLR
jgi:WD40 repeat protein